MDYAMILNSFVIDVVRDVDEEPIYPPTIRGDIIEAIECNDLEVEVGMKYEDDKFFKEEELDIGNEKLFTQEDDVQSKIILSQAEIIKNQVEQDKVLAKILIQQLEVDTVFKIVKRYYGMGLYSDIDVCTFVMAGKLTEDEYKLITGKDYLEDKSDVITEDDNVEENGNTTEEEVVEEPAETISEPDVTDETTTNEPSNDENVPDETNLEEPVVEETVKEEPNINDETETETETETDTETNTIEE